MNLTFGLRLPISLIIGIVEISCLRIEYEKIPFRFRLLCNCTYLFNELFYISAVPSCSVSSASAGRLEFHPAQPLEVVNGKADEH